MMAMLGKHSRLGAAAAVVLAVCLAACTPGSPATSQPAPATSSAPAGVAPAGPPPVSIAGYYAQRLSWQSCDKGFECARLYVPFDYSRPAGPRFSLPVVKLPAADPASRIGALVINPGGPGGSGVAYALGARSGEFTQEALNRFDIVGFDPRGVGGSLPAVRCMTGPQLDTYFATNGDPANAAQLATLISQSKLYATECARNATALLPYMGTVNAAKDMDVLRAALGDNALTYLGKSYGTYLGASYAQQFPSKVRALVLDGAVDPKASGLQLDVTQAAGFESAFGQFAAWCAGQQGCPLGNSASGAEAKVAGLLSTATAHPLNNMLGDGQPANGAMLQTGIEAALYERPEWPLLISALSDAFVGDGTVLVELADSLFERNPNGTYSNLADAELSVDCVDRPWPRSVSAYAAAAA
jgi:pimeloyl-ACP methyl ester carboxylesterase